MSEGSPLSPDVRAFMEPRFGRSFEDVRIHTDAHSTELSRELGARAFTLGSDVFFGNGKFRPRAAEGRKLLAHELAHVGETGEGGGTASDSTIVRRQPEPGAEGAGGSCRSKIPNLDEYAGDIDFHLVRAGRKLLFRGHDKRTTVKLLQETLKSWGCSELERDLLPRFGVDGVWGAETTAAVATFQQQLSLKVDGIVGPETLEAMDEHLGLSVLAEVSEAFLEMLDEVGGDPTAIGGVPISANQLASLPLSGTESLSTLRCHRRWQPCHAPRVPGTRGAKFTYHCPFLLGPVILPGFTHRAFATIPDEFVGKGPRGGDLFRCRPGPKTNVQLIAADAFATAVTRRIKFPDQGSCGAGYRANLRTAMEALLAPAGGGRPAGTRVNLARPGVAGIPFPCP